MPMWFDLSHFVADQVTKRISRAEDSLGSHPRTVTHARHADTSSEVFHADVYLSRGGSGPTDLFNDIVHLGCPDKGFGMFVVCFDVIHDGVDKFRYAAEHSTANALLCDLPEPSFDQVEP